MGGGVLSDETEASAQGQAKTLPSLPFQHHQTARLKEELAPSVGVELPAHTGLLTEVQNLFPHPHQATSESDKKKKRECLSVNLNLLAETLEVNLTQCVHSFQKTNSSFSPPVTLEQGSVWLGAIG